jgi:UDP-glucose 4-epimerase
MKRAIVTGATGFVGANLARRLLADGHEVHLFLRPGFRSWRIDEIRAAVQLHVVDFDDVVELDRLVASVKPDWIFHLAAHGAYATQTDVREMVRTNLVGTINLVESCLKVGFEALVNTGSSSEYGFKDHPPSESERLEPNSHYAVTKAAETHFCRYTSQSRGVRIPTLRLYSVYGPFEEPTRLIPRLIGHALVGKLPPLVNPAIARDFVYVDDVTEAYIQAATQAPPEPGAIYNVGTGVQTSLGDVVETVRRILFVSEEPRWGSMLDRQWDTSVWVADNRKIEMVLDWRPKTDLDRGIRAFANWLVADATRTDFYRDNKA